MPFLLPEAYSKKERKKKDVEGMRERGRECCKTRFFHSFVF
jgi:hypothetical protein